MRFLRSWSFLLALSLALYCFLRPQPLEDLVVPRRTEGSEPLVGDVCILLDFTVSPWSRSLLKDFAADFIGNASEAAWGDWQLFFGVVIFHENVSYPIQLSNDVSELQSQLQDPDWESNFTVSLPDSWPSSGLPRNTHEALQICNDWADHYTAVLLLTNGSASDWWSTMEVAKALQEKQATIYAIGLDNASERTANRSAELLELATDFDTQLDVILPPPAHADYTTATTMATIATTNGYGYNGAAATDTTTETTTESTMDTDTSTTSNSRRLSTNLTAINIRDLASLLGLDVVEELTLLASLTTTPASATGSTAPVPPVPGPAGLGGGLVVLIVLLSCCCTCSLIGIGFYFYKVDKARKSMAAKPTAVLPAPEPRAPSPTWEPPVPMDDTEKGLQEAIDARDLEKLRRWLSDVLLQGWPEPKYSDLILKALETVAQLKDSTRSSLEQRLAVPGGPVGSLASARLVGLEPELLQRAEEVRGRDDVMS